MVKTPLVVYHTCRKPQFKSFIDALIDGFEFTLASHCVSHVTRKILQHENTREMPHDK